MSDGIHGGSLRHELSFARDLQEQGVAPCDRVGERPRAERPPHAALAVVEVDRVLNYHTPLLFQR